MQRSRFLLALRESRLKTATVSVFLVVYMVSAFVLLNHGFGFVENLPAAGSLIADRLIHVVFFGFMIMLIFSSAVTAYIAIYRGRDMAWLLTQPLSHRAAFLWKCFESSLFAAWGLLIIIAPLLISFARQREVPMSFYLKSGLALIPFLVICCALGCLLLLAVGRFLNRRQFAVVAALGAVFVIAFTVRAALFDREIVESSGLSSAITFQRVLGHTQLATNRALPSTWLASSIIEWSHPYSIGRSALMPCLLLSHALALPLLLSFLARRWFYPSWNRSIQSNALAGQRRRRRRAHRYEAISLAPSWLPGRGRPMAAVTRKDFLTFFREPAQWVQFTLVFGLLLIYATGL